jgi:hypothetical protein
LIRTFFLANSTAISRVRDRQVGHEEQVGVTVALDIDADDRGAALLEHAYRLAADRAGRPGDDGDLVFEAGEVRHGGLSGSW